jgi:general secretion pathway protein N
MDDGDLGRTPSKLDLDRPAAAQVPLSGPRSNSVQVYVGRSGGAAGAALRGNPLWSIPLRSLSATRARPIFSPSRRPPAVAVAAPPPPAPKAPPSPPAPPQVPTLTLVGTIAEGHDRGIAVFLDQATQKVIRLKTGETEAGWILRRVRGRETMLEKNGTTYSLSLPQPGDVNAAAAVPVPPPGVTSSVVPGLTPVVPSLRSPASSLQTIPVVSPQVSGRPPGL